MIGNLRTRDGQITVESINEVLSEYSADLADDHSKHQAKRCKFASAEDASTTNSANVLGTLFSQDICSGGADIPKNSDLGRAASCSC